MVKAKTVKQAVKVLALFIVIGFFCKTVNAEGADVIYSGQSGDLDWSIDSEGCLTISGQGDVVTKDEYIQHEGDIHLSIAEPPITVPLWYQYRDKIKSAKVTAKIMNDCSSMFAYLDELETVDLSGMDSSTTKYFDGMFEECKNLKAINFGNIDTANGEFFNAMFSGCESLSVLDLSAFDMSKTESISFMFSGCSSLKNIDISNFKTEQGIECNDLFDDCSSLTEIDISPLNTKGVESMHAMFANCSSLKEIDLSSLNTDSLRSVDFMFLGCSSLTSIDISTWNTKNLYSMSHMFADCTSLKNLKLGSLGTSKIYEMTNMFENCSSLEKLDLRDWNTKNVMDMSSIFENCSSLKKLDLSSWNIKNVSDMSRMFKNCSSLKKLNLSGWNTREVTHIESMFLNCSQLESLDLSGFNLSWSRIHEDFSDNMLDGCYNLKNIKTPKEVANKIYLPDNGIWTDKRGTIYEVLPKKREKSIKLTKKKVTVPKPTIKKIKVGKKGKADVTFKKVKGVDGYQIAACLYDDLYDLLYNGEFDDIKKVYSKKSPVTISKLKKGRVYYFKVRAYKNVKGIKVYSKWSGLKKVEIKK